MKNRRSGFTLVEMIVAVGLVVLMMTLFATVFQIATAVMSKQKGFAENDQRARTVTILLKADLDKRTFRRVTAMGDVDSAFPSLQTGPEDSTKQAGYFYYSENNPLDDTDDVISWTVMSTLVQKNVDDSPYYGYATPLRTVGNTTNEATFANQNPNQPEADDGDSSNHAASSTAAEVCYFMRAGTLFRRVMLIRKPVDDAYTSDPQDGSTGAGTMYMTGGYTAAVAPNSFLANGTGHFYADFDFSAYNDGLGTHFHSSTALNNGAAGASGSALNNFLNGLPGASGINVPTALAIPNLRFGHSIRTGKPMEYATALGGANTFIGRMTHQETSHQKMLYPGVTPTVATDISGMKLQLDANGILQIDGDADGTWNSPADGTDPLMNGPRRGEDVVLSNVLGFDVKLFDDHVNVAKFVDLGYAEKVVTRRGYYWHGANKNPSYGPVSVTAANQNGADGQPGISGQDDDGNGTTDDLAELGWPGSDDPRNRVFDTWHSSLANYLGAPPFRPLDNGPDGQPGVAGVDDDNDMGTDNGNGEKGKANSDDRHPVRALQITIRYRDIASNQIRNLTIIQSLVD